MSQELWTAVDTYIKESMVPADPILTAALQAAVNAGLPAIAVSPTQGKLLHLMARMCGAAQNSGDRHAGRLQHNLAGAGSACRRANHHAGIGS